MANYTYGNVSTGTLLHFIKTSPNNITLKVVNKNVASTSEYGCNGAFFYGSDQISLAVNNDVPVQGVVGGYGSGWFNEKYKRGALVWDKAAGKYSVQVVSAASEIEVADRSQYWAQGGISMSLQDDANWKAIATQQNMPNIDGKTTRTALVWNTGFNLWLIVTETLCTAEQFRLAIKKNIGSGTLVDGIFLDGGGSSQMRCAEKSIDGDGRRVVQMVALTNK
jgi:exopolysaccharide biosynthesis protein